MSLISCPECGKEISDKSEKCISCGYPIKTYRDKDKQNKNKVSKKMLIHSIAVLAVICIVVVSALASNKNVAVEGKYYSFFVDDKNTYYEFMPSNNEKTEGTFKDVVYAPTDDDSFTFDYYIEDNILHVSRLFFETEYEIYKNYIVPVEYSYEGEIPKGKTFDAICTYDDTKIVFKKDGTVTEGNTSGTYVRDDDIIKVKYVGDNNEYNYMIYKGRLNNSARRKE